MEKFENINITKIDDQGGGAHDVFSGKVESETVRKTYEESVQYFSDLIKNQIAPGNYKIADLGSFKGELMDNLVSKLPEYDFDVISVERDENALRGNKSSNKKIVASLDNIPLENKSIDIAIARYVLVWNEIDKQREMIKEIGRVAKGFGIIQHSGSSEDYPEEWRKRISILFSGKEIPKLKRENHFFSSPKEIDKMMDEENIPYEKKQNRKINDIAMVFKEKYNLTENEYQKAKEIMGDMNYVIQSTWMIFPKKDA